MPAYIAVIERDGKVIPILKGGDGPDAECMATWDDFKTAEKEANEVPLAQAYTVTVLDLDDGYC